MPKRLIAGVTAIMLGLVLAAGPGPLAVGSARAAGPWSEPLLLSATDVTAIQLDTTGDAQGRVHVVWGTEPVTRDGMCGANEIYYASLENGRWSRANDIIASTDGNCLAEPSIAADPIHGRLHMVWQSWPLMYSSAPLAQAGEARAWDPPRVLDAEGAARNGDVVVDGRGRVHVAYYRGYQNTLYYLRSDDGGRTWGSPKLLFSGPAQTRMDRPTLAVDGRDRVHLVWSEGITDGSVSAGGRVLYVRSDDGGDHWEAPLVVDEKNPAYDAGYGAGEITVATYGPDTVHLIWAGPPNSTRWHKWSGDGGKTWQPARRIASDAVFEAGGLRNYNYGLGTAFDSAGRLHLVTSGSGNMDHVVFAGGRWSEPQNIIPGRGESLYPRIVATLGNQLTVVAAFHPPGETARDAMRIWAMHRETDAPRLQAEPAITVEPDGATGVPAPTAAPASTPVPAPEHPAFAPGAGSRSSGSRSSSADPASLGLGAAALAMMAVVAVNLNGRRRWRE